ncbi:ArsR family transcriptional regulator [Halobellus sp. Atlit-31R]|nr:ArsR family transcriptional regulator [Halobellus sp. Atlit-31R]
MADDDFYRALASGRRRRLLAILFDDSESTVDELANVLTGWETTEAGTMATLDDRDRIAVELRHVHLPVLDDVGLVTYDTQTGAVRLDDVDDVVSGLISRSIEAERLSRS